MACASMATRAPLRRQRSWRGSGGFAQYLTVADTKNVRGMAKVRDHGWVMA